MSKQLLIFFGVGVLAVGVAVFLAVSGNEGSHLQLKGKILKVRTGALGDGNSIAVLDLKIVRWEQKQSEDLKPSQPSEVIA